MPTMFAESPQPPAILPVPRSSAIPPTPLKVAVLADDQRTCLCLVTAMSGDGAQVKLYAPLAPHSRVKLGIEDGEVRAGRVAWVRDRFANILFDPLDDDQPRPKPRAARRRRRASPRLNVVARAIIRTPGQVFPGELANISARGARVRTCGGLDEGRAVSLVLPDMPAIRAVVCWSRQKQMGLLFDAPVALDVLAAWLAGRLRVSADADLAATA